MASLGPASRHALWTPLAQCRRWAGHNRWSKVRTIKGPRDAARSRLFQRMALMLRSAAREGGPDPTLNSQLANVVEQCRAKNMPKASIEAAIHGALRPTATSQLLLEARGPFGVALLLHVHTEDPRRSHRDLSLILARYGGTMTDGVRHSFEPMGVIRVAPRDAMGRAVGLEEALEVALEVGAQDVSPQEEEEEEEEEEPAMKFLCPPASLGATRDRVVAAGLLPLSAAIELVPRRRLALPEGPRRRVRGLLGELRRCPRVVSVSHNVQWEPEGGGRGRDNKEGVVGVVNVWWGVVNERLWWVWSMSMVGVVSGPLWWAWSVSAYGGRGQ